MKVVLLAGGFGTRLSAETSIIPKPMIEIGEMPIIWHIMKIYSHYGFNDFIICAGYKQHVIKKWFSDYFLHTSDITFDFTNDNEIIIHKKNIESWKVTIIDTGLNTQTGGRVKRIKKYVGEESFLLNYGDAVGDVNIKELVDFHKSHGKIGTISVYNFGQNKGVLDIDKYGSVQAFREKSDLDGDLINIGFMVFKPELFEHIKDDSTIFEKEPMNSLVLKHQLMAFTHKGYWQCMDNIREKQQLEKLWVSNNAPWKIWEK
jgi:glucose-1-phosphate cytidylyltransferase